MMEILPLLVFTTFGGIAAGAYVMSAFGMACAPNASKGANAGAGEADGRAWLFPLVCIVLLGVGLLGTLMHLGQPMRFINGMMNPGSMISQESYWAIAFGVIMVIDLVIAKMKGACMAAVRWVGAVAACGLMVVTGLAYYQCAFLPAWSEAITVPLFIVGDLAMGAGLCLVFAKRAELQRVLHVGNVAVSAAWLAVVVGYAVHLMGMGSGAAMVFVGAVIGPVACAVASAAAASGKLLGKTAGYVVVACAVVGVLLVRGAFFAAGVL